jgi:carbon-monoxide dehydrogenase small subunit
MIVATVNLLRSKPKPTMDDIREGLNGNLCRCTGYTRIFEAVKSAAENMTPETLKVLTGEAERAR